MLVKITFNATDVVEQGDGYVLIKAKYYAAFSSILWACSFKEPTIKGKVTGAAINGKNLFVGTRGGLSLE